MLEDEIDGTVITGDWAETEKIVRVGEPILFPHFLSTFTVSVGAVLFIGEPITWR